MSIARAKQVLRIEAEAIRTLIPRIGRSFQAAVDSGWGKEDFSAVTHLIEARIGRKISDD